MAGVASQRVSRNGVKLAMNENLAAEMRTGRTWPRLTVSRFVQFVKQTIVTSTGMASLIGKNVAINPLDFQRLTIVPAINKVEIDLQGFRLPF